MKLIINKKSNYLVKVIAVTLLYILISPLYALPITNLNDPLTFYADPSVTIAGDGASALLEEDPLAFDVLIVNDPGFGDLPVIIPGAGVFFSFDYFFTEGQGDDDAFSVHLIDDQGFSAGSLFEFSTETAGAGSVSFDLSSLAGMTIGVQFALSALFNDTAFTSSVLISNLQLGSITPVPEPSAWLLMLACVLVLLISFRKLHGREK